MKKNISLIGMPAAGKSTVGVILAKYMNMNFIDTDILIQSNTGKKLSEIIEKRGMAEFCNIEEEIVSGIKAENSIIATGGSVVYGERGMAHLQKIGDIIYLETSLSAVEKRISGLEERGVVHKSGQSINDLYYERVPLYKKWCDFCVDTSTGKPEDVIGEIIKRIKA